MASRYWVGGTATWDLSAGTKWATTSGGAGGASVPTSADDVFFDGSSGAGTVTPSVFSTCKTLNTTGFTGTLATGSITAAGSATIGAGTTLGTLALSITAAGTLTTNGKTLDSVTVSGSGIVVLGDALSCSSFLSVTGSGTFNTSNNNISCSGVTFANTVACSLGSSTITVTGSDSGGATVRIESGITLNAGTSTIKLTDSTANTKTFEGVGKTFYNFWFSPGSGTGALNVTGANTFNDFKDDGSAAHTVQFPASVTQTVSSFTVSGSAGNLISIRSSTFGARATLSKASGSVNSSYLDIQDSEATGGATWNAGVGSVNSGNNTGWNFPSFSGPPVIPAARFMHMLVR
jgi:hypothetical protein